VRHCPESWWRDGTFHSRPIWCPCEPLRQGGTVNCPYSLSCVYFVCLLSIYFPCLDFLQKAIAPIYTVTKNESDGCDSLHELFRVNKESRASSPFHPGPSQWGTEETREELMFPEGNQALRLKDQ
jgi:hypothetical protein